MPSRHLDWLHQADADLRHARQARGHAAHEWACFAAQQAAEKSIKAVLLRRGEDAWGYTVTALLGLVTTEEDAGAELIDSAKSLDKHYIPTRYPNGFDTGAPTDFYTKKDSDDAIRCAEQIVHFARSQVERPDGG
jgi:HEPN domain-containing protein